METSRSLNKEFGGYPNAHEGSQSSYHRRVNSDGDTVSSFQLTETLSIKGGSSHPKAHMIPYGKTALRPTNGPTDDALVRISSAVDKARRGQRGPRTERESLKNKTSQELIKRMDDGKYYEIPGLLDGFRMLNFAPAEDPEDVYSLDVSGQELEFVLEDDLTMFTKLQILKAGENQLPFARLGMIPNIRKLQMPCNDVTSLDLELEGRFENLEHLDLSYNALDHSAIVMLATLPSLQYLDLTRNGIKELPHTLKNMANWKDHVIEMLLPAHVAALDADGLRTSDSRTTGRPITAGSMTYNQQTPSELAAKRSFANAISASRLQTPGSAHGSRGPSARSSVAMRSSGPELNQERSRLSTAESRIRKMDLKVGFPALQTLVLENNRISNPDIFEILAVLPWYVVYYLLSSLHVLNLNHNQLTSLNALIPSHYEDSESVLNELPKDLVKYSGFNRLEELSLQNNKLSTMGDLVGLVCLPKIQRVYLNGNSVVTKFSIHSAAKAAKEDDAFNIFPSVYKINILDIPTARASGFTTEIAQYSVAPTRYGPIVVKAKKRKEVPHFIGNLLRKNAPAPVRGKRHEAPHKVEDLEESIEALENRNERRTYSFTDEDIDNIIRVGRIPKIKDLRLFSEIRDQMQEEARQLQNGQTSDPEKVGAKEVLFSPDKVDSTFITGVHITDRNGEETNAADDQQPKKEDEEEESSEAENSSEDDAEFKMHYPLPLSIQVAVRSLRHAVSNPVSYWRILEESYVRPTIASQNRKIPQARTRRAGPLDPSYDPEVHASNQATVFFDGTSRAYQTTPPDFITPANTIQTPRAPGTAPGEQDDHTVIVNETKEGEPFKQSASDVASLHKLVTKKLLNPDPDQSKASKFSYKKSVRFAGVKKTKASNGLQRARASGHMKPKDDFEEMGTIMADVDNKLLTIETDLAAVLGNMDLKKRIPQSQKLLEEIQAEYARLENTYMSDAEAAYRAQLEFGFTDIDEQEEYDNRLGSEQGSYESIF